MIKLLEKSISIFRALKKANYKVYFIKYLKKQHLK